MVAGFSCADLEAAFEEAERGVGDQCEQRGGDGSGEDEAVIDGGDTAKDQFSEAARAYGCRDGGDADAGDGRSAEAGEDEGSGEGEFDFEETLGIGEAEGAGDFDDGGVDGANAGVGVAQDGEQGVSGEGEDGKSGSVLAKPGDGQEEAEERERGDGLDDVREGDNGAGEGFAAGQKDSEGQADGGGEQDGAEGEPEVLEGEARFRGREIEGMGS